MFTLPDIIKSRLTAIKWLAALVLFALWTVSVYRFASSNVATACERDAAVQVATSASAALGQSEGLRAREGDYFKSLQGVSNAFNLNAQTDLSLFAGAVSAGNGLQLSIQEAIDTASCGVSDRAATERAGQAARALGAALAACDSEQREMAKDLADAINRGQTCQAEHAAAVTLTAASQVATSDKGSDK